MPAVAEVTTNTSLPYQHFASGLMHTGCAGIWLEMEGGPGRHAASVPHACNMILGCTSLSAESARDFGKYSTTLRHLRAGSGQGEGGGDG
jgi:hypothetical protein